MIYQRIIIQNFIYDVFDNFQKLDKIGFEIGFLENVPKSINHAI